MDDLEESKEEAIRTARVFRIALSCRPIDPSVRYPIRLIETEEQVTNLSDLQGYYLDNGTGQLDIPDEDTQLKLSKKLISLLEKRTRQSKLIQRVWLSFADEG